MSVLYNWIKEIPVLTAEEERDLARRYKKGDNAAGDKLIYHNLRLVLKIANDFTNIRIPFDDIVQEGNIGLIKAINKYDPERGFKFSTYAVYWIRQKIQRHLYCYGSGGLIRIPVHIGQEMRRIQAVERKLSQRLERTPEVSEIAEDLKIKPEKIEKLYKICADHADYDGDINNEKYKDYSLASILKDKKALDPGDLYECEDLKNIVSEILDELGPKDKKIMTLLFGLDGNEPRSLNDVAEIFNVSRERIRQIKARNIKKMHYYKRRDRLIDYY